MLSVIREKRACEVKDATSGFGIRIAEYTFLVRGHIEPVSRPERGSDPLSWFLPSISHCVTSEWVGGRGLQARTARVRSVLQSKQALVEMNPACMA